MNAVTTRIAAIQDVDAIAALFDAYRQFYGKDSDLALAATFIRERIRKNESVIIVAEREGNTIGFCQLYPTFCSISAAPIYILYDLFVLPASRNYGAGRALLLAAEQLAVLNQISRIDLSTAITNIPAQRLYESLGWKRDEEFFVYSKRTPHKNSTR